MPASRDAQALGLPAIRGEVVEDYAAGYHYYPDRVQVMAWFAGEGLEPVSERYDQEDGWGYRHLAAARPPSPVLIVERRCRPSYPGRTFRLNRNALSGSYRRFTAVSRSKRSEPKAARTRSGVSSTGA